MHFPDGLCKLLHLNQIRILLISTISIVFFFTQATWQCFFFHAKTLSNCALCIVAMISWILQFLIIISFAQKGTRSDKTNRKIRSMRNSRRVAIIAVEIKISSISTFLQYSKKILYKGQYSQDLQVSNCLCPTNYICFIRPFQIWTYKLRHNKCPKVSVNCLFDHWPIDRVQQWGKVGPRRPSYAGRYLSKLFTLHENQWMVLVVEKAPTGSRVRTGTKVNV